MSERLPIPYLHPQSFHSFDAAPPSSFPHSWECRRVFQSHISTPSPFTHSTPHLNPHSHILGNVGGSSTHTSPPSIPSPIQRFSSIIIPTFLGMSERLPCGLITTNRSLPSELENDTPICKRIEELSPSITPYRLTFPKDGFESILCKF
jgi:hypothetical protein